MCSNSQVVGGTGLLRVGQEVRAHAFTGAAREAIEAAGGACVVLSRTTHRPVPVVVTEAGEGGAGRG